MTVHAIIEAEFHPGFNAYAAYERERDHSRRIERDLTRALQLLGMECDRREGRGEDVAHIRAFIERASQ